MNVWRYDIIRLIIIIGWLARPKLWWRNNVYGAPGDPWINREVGHFSHIWSPINRSIWTCRRSNDLWQDAMKWWTFGDMKNGLGIYIQMSRATGTVPERVQSRVHTTEPTGPVPEPFHCDHITRWSARSGTTGRSGTGVNTGARLRSGTVPVSKLWCEHGHRYTIAMTGLQCNVMFPPIHLYWL